MVNSRDIKELHPTLQRAANELTRRMKEKGWSMGISSTYRDYEYQNYLYEQGRTRAGNIVTNCKGGQSIHNYRLAFDIFNNVAGNLYPSAFMKLAGKIGMEMGLTWGGSWKSFVDEPHFEFMDGLSLAQLQKGAVVSSNAVMKWEKSAPAEKEEDSEMVEKRIIDINGSDISADVIMKDGSTFVKLRELEKAGFNIGYNEGEKKASLSFEPKMKVADVNGTEKALEMIMLAGSNYVKLRELGKLGVEVWFDEVRGIPVLSL